MLDVLSGGRVEFGQAAAWRCGYEELGVEYGGVAGSYERGSQAIEAPGARSGSALRGAITSAPRGCGPAAAIQQPRPPIWITASVDPASFRWIGEQGYDLRSCPGFPTAEQNVAIYREAERRLATTDRAA